MADDDSGFDGDERMDDARSEDGAAADVGEDGADVDADADGGVVSAPVAPVGPDPLQLSVIQDPKLRFILELEFVEMLASPHYLQFLAQSRFLVDPAFLNYLSYLQYWHSPPYVQYITHPHCLYFLDMLRSESFRSALLRPAYITLLHEQQFWHWRSGRYNRYMEAEQKREQRAMENARRAEEEKQKLQTTAPSVAADAQTPAVKSM